MHLTRCPVIYLGSFPLPVCPDVEPLKIQTVQQLFIPQISVIQDLELQPRVKAWYPLLASSECEGGISLGNTQLAEPVSITRNVASVKKKNLRLLTFAQRALIPKELTHHTGVHLGEKGNHASGQHQLQKESSSPNKQCQQNEHSLVQ